MKWIGRLGRTFGAPFLLLVTSIYWTQGFRSLAWMGVSYQMKDQLKLSPSASQFVMSTSFLPWSIKPLYGIFSDCVPIFGRRRIPYLVISSVLCFVPWLVLGAVEWSRSSYIYLTVLLTIQNFGAAMADVVVDAMVAEMARKERAEFAGELQSMSWLAMAFGGILGSIAGGVALDRLQVSGIFMMFATFPLVQLLSCAFLDDRKLGNSVGEIAIVESPEEKLEAIDGKTESVEEQGIQDTKSSSPNDVNEALDDPESKSLRRRRGSLDRKEVETEEEMREEQNKTSPTIRGACRSLYQAVKQPSVFRPMLWFLISQSAVPNLSTIMFYFQTNSVKLDASFLGTSRVVGWGGLMLGTFLYNHYLKRVSLRKIFRLVHIGLAILTLSDVVFVSRLNTRMGIPDKVFVLGASAVGDAVNQFKFMPFLVFSGQICPPGIEGTLFALFMSISNLGGTISSFAGAALASALQISSQEFGNLSLGIVIQAACTLLPVLLLGLIPEEATGMALTHNS
ncbi:probable folate-biopterin transporter 4 isoform X1 [Selaginella moellendorffii]|uniref:probable folate-biopterin transporter 4 isoform X1 n=1 Tax=Selaginella moellendorffii TaxID=88036 RepID=UPI000D1CD107|nr:probable folate-biopterin transporter 4 isoform X1 [Selaginella moellendorffii]|eukprot:XP_024522735.1 probable folate-biopterin transporter 4 isoform X1 [Selaginella moellendorffii]